MARGSPGAELRQSVRILATEELWFPLGLVVAGFGYALWVGFTGAAVTFLAETVVGAVTVDPWRPVTTGVAAVLALLWFLVPAALAVVGLVDRLTNLRGNIEACYRFEHPTLLLVPPAVLLAAGAGAVVAGGLTDRALLWALVVVALWFLVRTAAFAYRVFAFSVPQFLWAAAFVTALVVLVAVHVDVASLAGRESVIAAVAGWLAGETGLPSLAEAPTATVTVRGTTLPALLAAAVAVPVALSLAYVACQTVVATAVRLYEPTVKRSELRAGQRYPEFAHPAVGADVASSGDETARAASGADPGTTTGGATNDGRTGDAGDGSADSGTGPATGADAGTDTVSSGTDSAAGSGSDSASAPASGSRSGADAGAAVDAGGGSDSESTTPDGADDVGHTRVFTPSESAPDPDEVEAAAGGKDGDEATGGPACPACGARADAGATFCPDCGTRLEE